MKSTFWVLIVVALLSGCAVTKVEVRYEEYSVAVELDDLGR
jgi:hypothetical protein